MATITDVIIKNIDSVDHIWGGIDISANTQYVMQEVDRVRFQADSDFINALNANIAVINNGDEDLSPTQGLLHLYNKLVFIHEDMDLYPAAGEFSPAGKKVSAATFGFEFKIGDEMFSQGRLDDIVGDEVLFEGHWCIDNNVSDRWIAFEISLIATSGGSDKNMSIPDETVTIGPILVPETANQIFRLSKSFSTTLFQNGEKYLFLGIKRIDVTSFGKTGPANNPILFRTCKIYARTLDK